MPQAIHAEHVTIDHDPASRRLTRAVGWVRAHATRPPDVRPYLVGELFVVLCLLRLYDFVREHADVRKSDALRYGAQILHLERVLHIAFEPSLNHWTVEHHAISLVASYWYQFVHLTITLSVLLWCWWSRPRIYRRARNALVLINIVGLTVFLLLPVAPPRLLPGAGFIDADRLAGFGSNNVGPVTADAFGAFPSLHIAWAVWTSVVAFTLMKQTRYARFAALWIGYPFITLMAIVMTGNHYVLDAVAGALLAGVAVKVSRLR